MWTTTSPSTIEVLIFFHGTSLVNSIIFTKTLIFAGPYVTRRLLVNDTEDNKGINCTSTYLRKATFLQVGLFLPHAQSHRSIVKVLSWKRDLHAPRLQSNDHAKTTGSVSDKYRVAAEM